MYHHTIEHVHHYRAQLGTVRSRDMYPSSSGLTIHRRSVMGQGCSIHACRSPLRSNPCLLKFVFGTWNVTSLVGKGACAGGGERGGLTGSSPTRTVHWSSPQYMKGSLPCTYGSRNASWEFFMPIHQTAAQSTLPFWTPWDKYWTLSLLGMLLFCWSRLPSYLCFVIYWSLKASVWTNGFHLANRVVWDQSKGLDLFLSESLITQSLLNNVSGTNVSGRRSPLKVGASRSVIFY